MSTINLTELVTGTVIEVKPLNDNFNGIANVLNGGITNSNIDNVTETKVSMTSSGHDHSNGKGNELVVATDVRRGGVLFQSGTTAELGPVGQEDIVFTTEFTSKPSVTFSFTSTEGGGDGQGYKNIQDDTDNPILRFPIGIYNITTTGMTIQNNHNENSYFVYWVAIGV